MGQQHSTQTDGASAVTSPHSTSASSSPPSSRTDTSDMRPTSVWGSNNNNLGTTTSSSCSDQEFGDNINLRPKSENEVTRMSIRAVIDTFIENCLSSNNDNSPQAEDKPLDRFQSNDVIVVDQTKGPVQQKKFTSADEPDCQQQTADCDNDIKMLTDDVKSEVKDSDNDVILVNSLSEQGNVTNASSDQPSEDKNQAEECGGQVTQPSSQPELGGPAAEKEMPGNSQETKSKEQSQSASGGAQLKTTESLSIGAPSRTTERQTFSAYLQERLKTIDLDKREELTQLASSKNIQCQGQMIMWESVKKPSDDYDSASQLLGSFPSGPVKLQTVIDRVLDKSLLNNDRGRDIVQGAPQSSSSRISPALSTNSAAKEPEVQSLTPATKRLCFKDHIEKVLLESFLSFEEEEKAEALKAEAQNKLTSAENSGNKMDFSVKGERTLQDSAKFGTDRSSSSSSSSLADRAISSRSGTSKVQIDSGRQKSANSKTFVDSGNTVGGKNRMFVDSERLNKGGVSRPGNETERLKAKQVVMSAVDGGSISNKGGGEFDSDKLNKDGYHVTPGLLSDGSVSVQDIVDQVINQTEMISRLLTPSSRESSKLASSAVSLDQSVSSANLASQSSPGQRYQDSNQNRSLMDAQRHAVHKEHQSSTTLGRKRGRPRLGSPVHTSAKSMSDAGKMGHHEPRFGPVAPQLGSHPHGSLSSKDYLISNHFPPQFSPLASPQTLRSQISPQISMRPPQSATYQQDLIHKQTAKNLASPTLSMHHPHDGYHQQRLSTHYQNHQQTIDSSHIPSGGHLPTSSIHAQQLKIDCIKENISSSNRLIPVSHIPTKTCSCLACVAHFTQRKSPSQFIHVQQPIHPHPFSKSDNYGDKIHQPRIQHPPSTLVSTDFHPHPSPPAKHIHNPGLPFPGQPMPSLMSVQLFKKDIIPTPRSSDLSPGESGCYPSIQFQPNKDFHIVESNVGSNLLDPQNPGISQSEVYIPQSESLRRVGKDARLVIQDNPKFQPSRQEDPVDNDIPLDLSVKPGQSMRSNVHSGADRTRPSEHEISVTDSSYILPFPVRSQRAELQEQDQQTSSSHHLQKLENSVDRFLLHRHAQPQLHVSLYSPTGQVPVYQQVPRYPQQRSRAPQSDASYHTGADHLHSQIVRSWSPHSPGHVNQHCPSPASQQLHHQTSFIHPSSAQQSQHHRHDIPEVSSEQFQVPRDNLSKNSKDQTSMSAVFVEYQRSSSHTADYQRPSSHNQDNRSVQGEYQRPPSHNVDIRTVQSDYQRPTSHNVDIRTVQSDYQRPPSHNPDIRTVQSDYQRPLSHNPDIKTPQSDYQRPPSHNPDNRSVQSDYQRPPSHNPDIRTPQSDYQRPPSHIVDTRTVQSDYQRPPSHNPDIRTVQSDYQRPSHNVDTRTVQSDYQRPPSNNPDIRTVQSDYQRPPSHNPDVSMSADTSSVGSSPSLFHSSPPPDESQKLNFCKHEPIQNIIGNHSPNDILYLICRICKQTYGSPYGFRKHFRNQHGFEPKADHTVIQTITATKAALAHPEPSESAKRVVQNPQFTKEDKHYRDVNYPHDQLIKTSPADNAASRLPDSVSADDCKSDALKELPTATKCLECLECGQTFQLNDFGSYKRHCRQHGLHRNSRPFACHDCEKSFSEPALLEEHLSSHSKFTASDCGICQTFFSSPAYLADHLQAAHGVGGGDRPTETADAKPVDSIRKCISEPVIIADKSTSYSDVPISLSSSSGSKTAIPVHSPHQLAHGYVPAHPSSSSANPSSQSSTPSSSITSTITSAATTQSAQPLTANKQSTAKSSSSSLPTSKPRFNLSSDASKMLTVHTPKGLEIQKLPADAVVTSASPDSSYDDAKLLCGSSSYPSESSSSDGMSREGNYERVSNSSQIKVSSKNSPVKSDDLCDKSVSECDKKDKTVLHTSSFAASPSQDISNASSLKSSGGDKSYEHKKYSRHRKRVTTGDDSGSEAKHQKVSPSDKDSHPSIHVSSTLNLKVTVQDCESSSYTPTTQV